MLVNDLALHDSLVIPVAMLVMVSVFALPAFSGFSFPLNLPGSVSAGPADRVGQVDDFQNVLLQLCQ